MTKGRNAAGQIRHPVWAIGLFNWSVLALAFVVATFPHEKLEKAWLGALDNDRTGFMLIPAPTTDAGDLPNRGNPDFPYRHLALTSELLGRPEGWTDSYRALRLAGAELMDGKVNPWETRGKGETPESAYKECGTKPGIASLQNTNLAGAQLQKADLSRAWLKGALISRALLQGARLSGAQLPFAVLSMALLPEVDLKHVQLQGANLSGALLLDANLTGAQLQGANLRSAQLPYAVLSQTLLPNADLSRALLAGANLSDALLPRAKLSDALLPRADLSSASLQGTDLSESTLGSTAIRRVAWGPLTGQILTEVISTLTQELASSETGRELSASILERVTRRLDGRLCESGFADLVAADRLLCGSPDFHPGCMDDESAFYTSMFSIWADVACSQPDGADSLADRLVDSSEDDAFEALPALERLLAEDCGGAESLSDETRQRVQDRVAELKRAAKRNSAAGATDAPVGQ